MPINSMNIARSAGKSAGKFALVGTLVLCAACTTTVPPAPPPPPPPEPVVETIPYRPLPPPQAAYQMDIPLTAANGQRLTVNANLSEVESIWHFRSGWNVAALNCQGDANASVIDGYRVMLQTYNRELSSANTAMERQFRSYVDSDRAALLARETHSTGVYNYFAQPAARAGFCATARQIANELLESPPQDYAAFAVSGLARYEEAFERFFRAYEEYERASASWDYQYGSIYGPSQPGWVAVHGTEADRMAAVASQGASTTVSQFLQDPDTGAQIPFQPLDETNSSTPVVQPLPTQ